jgi:two-component system chemotaxis response regulator CheB
MAVFVGASAGGVETLVELLAPLPPDLPAPVLVVLHISRRGQDMLASILDRAGPLSAVTAEHGQRRAPGVVYVAPRDRHMLVEHGAVVLCDGPAEHGVRPAIDPLFRSGAREYRAGAVGVVLSGMLDDGTAGLGEIRREGGQALVQDPDEALDPQMPTSAIANVDEDGVLPLAALAAMIDELVRDPLAQRMLSAAASAEASGSAPAERRPAGMRTDLICPLCSGRLWETAADGQMTYRCAAGHTYTAPGLLAAQHAGLDDALWRPVRILHQQGSLQQRLAAQARAQGRKQSARYFAGQAEATLRQADKMRRMLGAETARDAGPDDEAGGAG